MAIERLTIQTKQCKKKKKTNELFRTHLTTNKKGIKMKKALLSAFICIILMACGKDDITEFPQSTPAPAPEQPKESDSPTEQPQSPATVTQEDIAAYFGFDKSKDVNVAAALTHTRKETQQINGKTISLADAEIKSKDEQGGSLVLHVAGKVNETSFDKEFTYSGFVKKPGDYQMANRAQVKWKEGINPYETFDFDGFYRLHKTDMFSTDNLERMMDFHSSATETGYMYPFTSEDIKKTTIDEVKYEGQGQISFSLKYNNIKSKSRFFLPFDKNKYYEGKITISTDFIKQSYMRGIYENPALFNGLLFSYDDETYAVVINENRKEKSDSDNTLTLHLSLRAKSNGDIPLAEFDKTFAGFKPLKELKNELKAHLTAVLHEFMKEKVKNSGDGDVTNRLSMSIEKWIRHVEFVDKKEQKTLVWEKNRWGKNVLSGLHTSMKDIYLDNVRFELTSAKLNEEEGRKFLHITFRMTGANELVLTDDAIEFKMSIHIPS